jgi:alkylation response protein AidB-like acyl-CoA dehydrogenase
LARHHSLWNAALKKCFPSTGRKTSQEVTEVHTSFSPEDIAFRDEVREFFDTAYDEEIAARLSNPDTAVFQPAIIEWQKRLFDRGWIAPGWPLEMESIAECFRVTIL